jgi:pyridoxine 5-phosphate synthase
MPTALSVNMNKIALLRNSREGNYPNVVSFAELAIQAGAKGITVHPRPDQRHIRPSDVEQLKRLTDEHEDCEFNVEGNPFEKTLINPAATNDTDKIYPGFMEIIDRVRPDQATLVPDSNDQLTSDHGFDLREDTGELEAIIQQLKQWNVRVSLFMDPDIEQIDLAKAIGADRIEFYTGPYAANFNTEAHQATINTYRKAAQHAYTIGLTINAGHDLNQTNLAEFLTIAPIAEVSIGHALTVESLLNGYKNTVASYSKICQFDYTRE